MTDRLDVEGTLPAEGRDRGVGRPPGGSDLRDVRGLGVLDSNFETFIASGVRRTRDIETSVSGLRGSWTKRSSTDECRDNLESCAARVERRACIGVVVSSGLSTGASYKSSGSGSSFRVSHSSIPRVYEGLAVVERVRVSRTVMSFCVANRRENSFDAVPSRKVHDDRTWLSSSILWGAACRAGHVLSGLLKTTVALR